MSETASGTVRTDATANPLVHAVRVDAKLDEHLLRVYPERLVVRPGDSILWQFSGLRRPWSPVVALSPTGEGNFLGPFTGFTNLPSGVLAPVAGDAADGAYAYRAQLQLFRGEAEARAFLMGPTSTVVVNRNLTGENHVIDVGLGIDPETGQEILTLSRDVIGFSRGDSVVWRFSEEIFAGSSGLDPLPRVTFVGYQGDGSIENLRTGPFNCLTYGPRQVTGTSPNGVPGTYHYRVAMVEAVGGEIRWLSSGDPAVDERPEPPGLVLPATGSRSE